MAENDISKIINLIMQNPKLIEDIKGLISTEDTVKAEDKAPIESEAESVVDKTQQVALPLGSISDEKSRRRALLFAIKPYVSEKRCAAIDSMMTVADILDMMKAR